MIKKIALVPLDNRPCNKDFPVKIGKIAGVQVLTPPRETIGSYLIPGNPAELAKWLKSIAGEVDAVIVSSDMLSYGGLIASRKLEISFENARQNFKVLEAVRKQIPKPKIFLFSVIMRLSITSTEESEMYWQDVFEYSKLADRIEIYSEPEDKKRFEEIKDRIPKEVLQEYLKTRKRNHEINRLVVEMVDRQIVDRLILGIEDAAPFGLHRSEIRILQKEIAEKNIKSKTDILCGADELAAVLLTRLILDSIGEKPKIFIDYANPNSASVVPLYEDRTLHQTILDHIKACGGVQAKVKDEAHLILYVNTPSKKQKDLFLESQSARDKISLEKLKSEVLRLNKLLNMKKPVALLDVAYANGADSEFVNILLDMSDITKLKSFAAWNTAGNSAGSALAEALTYLISSKTYKTKSGKTGLAFLFERFLDDYAYQSIVREKIKENIKDKVSVYNLGRYYTEIEWVVKEDIAQLAGKIFEKHFRGKEGIRSMACNISLPWPRLFEVDINVEFN